MAKKVIINGVTYDQVPHINVPLAEAEGDAKFVDTDIDESPASSVSILQGKKAWVNGEEVTGTIPVKTDAALRSSGRTVTVPTGYYPTDFQKSVASGSVTPSAAVTGSVVGTAQSDYEITATATATIVEGYVNEDTLTAEANKYIQVEDKTVTPSTSAQSIQPTTGKLIKSITVNAVDIAATATAADVIAGKTFFAGNLTRKTGTATFPTVSQDATTKVLTIS